MAESEVGKVVHYYDKIGVAILELTGELAIGDTVKFVRGGQELLEQQVESMQIEHEQVDKAAKGASVGVKTIEKIHEGTQAYKVG